MCLLIIIKIPLGGILRRSNCVEATNEILPVERHTFEHWSSEHQTKIEETLKRLRASGFRRQRTLSLSIVVHVSMVYLFSSHVYV